MKLSRKMILVPEEEYLQLTQTNTGKPEEKCTKMYESAENFTIMNQMDTKCTKVEQPRQKSTKIGASTENSTQTESALDENPIQTKWGFEKRTKIDQPNIKGTKLTQLPEKCAKSTPLQKISTKTTQPVKPRGPPGIPS